MEQLVVLPEGCRLYGQLAFAYKVERKRGEARLRLCILSVPKSVVAVWSRKMYPGVLVHIKTEDKQTGYLMPRPYPGGHALLLHDDLMHSCARLRPYSEHSSLIANFSASIDSLPPANVKSVIDLLLDSLLDNDESIWDALVGDPNVAMRISQRVSVLRISSFAKANDSADQELVRFARKHWRHLID